MNKADIDNINTVAKACEGFEPIEAFKLNELTAEGVRVTALVSIARSLKRIADKLELSQKQPIIMTADEALKFYAAKDGC